MPLYIIRFIEKPTNDVGSSRLEHSSEEREISDIDNEKAVRTAIEEAFKLAVEITNDNIKQVMFGVANHLNEILWQGEGMITGERIKIVSLFRIIARN